MNRGLRIALVCFSHKHVKIIKDKRPHVNGFRQFITWAVARWFLLSSTDAHFDLPCEELAAERTQNTQNNQPAIRHLQATV